MVERAARLKTCARSWERTLIFVRRNILVMPKSWPSRQPKLGSSPWEQPAAMAPFMKLPTDCFERIVRTWLSPCFLSNDYAFSFGSNKKLDDPTAVDTRQVDVGWVQSETGKERFFVNTLGLGFSGLVSVESRRIRWLQGLLLYGLAFLRTICFRFERPNMTIAFDGIARASPTLSLTVAIGKREGGFVVAPEAVIDDGLFDYLHAGGLSRWEVLRFMPRLASGGQLPKDHPRIWLGRCREVDLESEAPLTVHLDGEFFALPQDSIRRLQIRILPGRLKVRTLALRP